jgi:prevent-host-death family protein
MKFITVSELRLQATKIVSRIETTKDQIVVTKKGKPVVLMRPVEEGEFELKTRRKK